MNERSIFLVKFRLKFTKFRVFCCYSSTYFPLLSPENHSTSMNVQVKNYCISTISFRRKPRCMADSASNIQKWRTTAKSGGAALEDTTDQLRRGPPLSSHFSDCTHNNDTDPSKSNRYLNTLFRSLQQTSVLSNTSW